MIVLIGIWSAIFSVIVNQDVPNDCFTIYGGSLQPTYCYTFTDQYEKKGIFQARDDCESRKGQLAVMSNGTVWNLLKQQFLVNLKYSSQQLVWMGVSINASGQTVPSVNLNFVKWYKKKTPGDCANKCPVAYTPEWMIDCGDCNSLSSRYFCQYQTETSCSTKQTGDRHGVIDSTCSDSIDVPLDTTVHVTCSPGYYLITNSTITCRWGKWDNVQCIPGCPEPGIRNNAQLTSSRNGYKIGDRVIYICDDNCYSWSDHRMTHFILTCQNDSTWSDKGAANCGNKNKFSVTTINITSLTTSVIKLVCDVHNVETVWFRNGEIVFLKEFRSLKSQFNMTDGNLIVQTRDADVEGMYICAEIKPTLRMGNTAYELIGSNKCETQKLTEIQISEGGSLLLPCPQVDKDYSVSWFKDDEKLFSNNYHNIIQSTGLYIPNVKLQDGGIYKCLTSYTNQESRVNCKQNIPYEVTVTAPAEKICGDSNSHHQPWLAVIYHLDENIPFCYGTLLNSRWVVTSAFCLSSLRRKKTIGVKIQLGAAGHQQIFKVASVKLHPRYRRRLTTHDIGLLQIYGSPVQFTKNILPACISSDDIGKVHKCESVGRLSGIVARRGSLVDSVDPDVLEVEYMSLDPKENCRESKTIGFAEDKFCAMFNGSEENFAGDNGSPFLVNYKGKSYLLGVYTWGERSSGSGKYDYFTSTYPHYDWIKNTISEM